MRISGNELAERQMALGGVSVTKTPIIKRRYQTAAWQVTGAILLVVGILCYRQAKGAAIEIIPVYLLIEATKALWHELNLPVRDKEVRHSP